MLSTSPAARAQTHARWTESVSQEEETPLWRSINEAVGEGEWLEAARIADRYRAQSGSVLSEWQAFFYAWSGRPDLVAALQAEGLLPDVPFCETAAGLEQRDALEAVVAAAADRRAVIIQEFHWEAQHRLLLSELLPRLRALGFSVFAAEDFAGAPEDYGNLRYPGAQAAFHSKNEPVFADAVRDAIALGYRLVPYEASFPPPPEIEPWGYQAYRSDQQATNLYERIFANDPDVKALIHLGVGWGREAPNPDFPGDYPMVVRFKELSGIDPLTVDQMGCRLAEPQGRSGAVIAFAPDGAGAVQGHPPGTFDMQIRYGSETYDVDGRASWLAILGRKPVPVPEALRPPGRSVVVEARLADEPDDATPFDRLYLGEDEMMPLMLAPGEYRITALPDDGGEAVLVTVE